MTLQSDTKHLLESVVNPGSNQLLIDRAQSAGGGLSLNEIVANRFRVGVLAAEQQEIFQQCLDNCCASNSPVEFCIPIGGYKKWRLASYPEADWAELLHLSLMRDLALRIVSKYESGVRVTYIWDNVFVLELNVNRFPPDSVRKYCDSLQALLDFYNSLCSGMNIVFTMKKMTDCYDRDRYLADLQEPLSQAEYFWNSGSNSDHVRDLEDKARIHCYNENGDVDQPIIRKAAQQIWAHNQVFSIPVFANTQTQIPVLLRKASPQFLHLRSYYTSEVQFWVGEGVIIQGKRGLYPSIVSQNNPRGLRLESVVPTGEFSHLGKNFRTIKAFSRLGDEG